MRALASYGCQQNESLLSASALAIRIPWYARDTGRGRDAEQLHRFTLNMVMSFHHLPAETTNRIRKPPAFQKRAQAACGLSAPHIFSTPFLSVPYQKIGSIEEWCRNFWSDFPECAIESAKYMIFSILHRISPAFAYRIRAPPSEI